MTLAVRTNGDPEDGFGVLFGLRAGTVTFSDALDWRMNEGTFFDVVTPDINEDGADDVVLQSSGEGLHLFLGGPERAWE